MPQYRALKSTSWCFTHQTSPQHKVKTQAKLHWVLQTLMSEEEVWRNAPLLLLKLIHTKKLISFTPCLSAPIHSSYLLPSRVSLLSANNLERHHFRASTCLLLSGSWVSSTIASRQWSPLIFHWHAQQEPSPRMKALVPTSFMSLDILHDPWFKEIPN